MKLTNLGLARNYIKASGVKLLAEALARGADHACNCVLTFILVMTVGVSGQPTRRR